MSRAQYQAMVDNGEQQALRRIAFDLTKSYRSQRATKPQRALSIILSFNELPGLSAPISDVAVVLARLPSVMTRLTPATEPASLLSLAQIAALADQALVDYADSVFLAQTASAMRAAAITEALRFYTQTNGDPSQSEFASTIDSFTVEIEAGLTEF